VPFNLKFVAYNLKFVACVHTVHRLVLALHFVGGAVYVRWGHIFFPSTVNRLYHGISAGSDFRNTGSGSNPLCLPHAPTYDISPITSNRGRGSSIHRARYSSDMSQMPCAVCHVSQRSAVYTFPAQPTCPTEWTLEYTGFLMASHNDHQKSDFICVQKNPFVQSSPLTTEGLLFYNVEANCTSLPCPHYQRQRALTCAVCSK